MMGVEFDRTITKAMTITRREREVLQLIADEFTSRQIAERLYISPSTVENHRINLLAKLGARNAVGMVVRAVRLGLIV